LLSLFESRTTASLTADALDLYLAGVRALFIVLGIWGCDATPAGPSGLAGVPDATVSSVDVSDATSAIDTAPTTAADAAPGETGATTTDVAGVDAADAPDAAPDAQPDAEVPECGADAPCDPGLVCVAGECVCDETPVSFSADVRPLLTSGCGPGCHVYTSAASGSAQLNLHANHAHADLVGVPAYQCSGGAARARVEPGDVGASYLMDKLLGRDMCRGIQMPKGRSPWSADRLALLGRWICQGARDD